MNIPHSAHRCPAIGPHRHRRRTATDRRLARVRHAAGTRRRHQRRDRAAGGYVLVVLTAGAYLPSPLYPHYQHAFDFGELTMTLIYATFALVSAPALLLFGSASDALGPRIALRAGITAGALGSTCFVLATGPLWLVAGRAAQGLALGAATGAAVALLSARSGRARGGVLASIAFVAGTAAGPVVAGVLAEFAAAPYVLPYAAHLALLAVGWHLVARIGGARPARWPRPTCPRIPATVRVPFAAAAITGFLAWTVAGLFLAVIPTLLGRTGQSSVAVTGGVLGLVLMCSVLTQPLVPRLGPTAAQLLGLAALLASLGTLALHAAGSLAGTLAAGLVAGAGHGLAYGGAATAVDRVAPDTERGAVSGALYLAFYLGAGVPAIVVGVLTSWYPLDTATAWVAGIAAGVVPLAAVAVAHAQGIGRRQVRGVAAGAAPRPGRRPYRRSAVPRTWRSPTPRRRRRDRSGGCRRSGSSGRFELAGRGRCARRCPRADRFARRDPTGTSSHR